MQIYLALATVFLYLTAASKFSHLNTYYNKYLFSDVHFDLGQLIEVALGIDECQSLFQQEYYCKDINKTEINNMICFSETLTAIFSLGLCAVQFGNLQTLDLYKPFLPAPMRLLLIETFAQHFIAGTPFLNLCSLQAQLVNLFKYLKDWVISAANIFDDNCLERGNALMHEVCSITAELLEPANKAINAVEKDLLTQSITHQFYVFLRASIDAGDTLKKSSSNPIDKVVESTLR